MRSQCQVRSGWLVLAPTLLALGGWLAAMAGPVLAHTFTNATPINLPAGAPASPYPSTIEVSRLDSPIARVSVSLTGVRHPRPEELRVLLVGPEGQAVMLMSSAGGDHALLDVTLTFAQGSGVFLPDSDPIVSGIYEPTDHEPGNVLPAPAPAGPYGTDLTVFSGTNPNGTWQLFAHGESAAVGGGAIGGGWILELGQEAIAPVIIRQPQSQMVAPDSTVILDVAVSGTSPLNYQWRLNGVPLPGQTNPTLVLEDMQAGGGGSFRLTVWNPAGVLTSDPATVVVRAANNPPPTDQFRDRPRLDGMAGIVQGNSSEATSEPDEPHLPGGGKSVWFEWTAPADGIVTFRTQGSAFDTLLGVFTGTALDDLTLVSSDDDRGGFYTSQVEFNASRGTRYQIALDGFGPGGAGGEFTVGWELEETDEQVPVMVTVPQPQSVLPGTDATFSVMTDSPSDTFQWFHNDAPIPGATGDHLTVAGVQPTDLGIYWVRIGNPWGRFAQSPPVNLEIASFPSDLSQMQYQKAQASGNRPAVGFVSIALGGAVWKQDAVPAPGPPVPCGDFWGSIAQGLHAEDDGIILVHTTGSDVDARIAVYQGSHLWGDTPIACAPAGNPAMLLFSAVQGHDYTVEVDGVEAGGNITLTNLMGIAPPIPEAPDVCLIPPGGSTVLDMPATNWVPVPDCQWLFNGQEIPGATNTSLLVTNFNEPQVGAYSVLMSNFVRTTTKPVAHLDLAGPLLLQSVPVTIDGVVDLVLTASNAPPFLLVTATNLAPNTPWLPLATNQGSCLTFVFTNANLLAEPRRFFRAIPWPPLDP
jgi:hypothetical protein